MKPMIKVEKNMKKIASSLLLIAASSMTFAASNDDPLLYKVMIDKLELSDASSNPTIFEGGMWIGKDLNKFWLKSDIEIANGVTEGNTLELLYSKALYPFWDVQMGAKIDKTPSYKTTGLVLAMKGLAPYLFDVDASLYLEDTGQFSGNLQAEYEYMVTQKFIVSPELTMNIHTKDDATTGTGSGLADLELGLRARYEIRREIAPYIGINWKGSYGKTADYLTAASEPTSEFNVVAGVRAWF